MRRRRWKQRRAAATKSCGNSRRRTRADEGKRAGPFSGHGKARRIPLGVVALRAARAADRGDDRIFLLACGAGFLVLLPAAGCLRHQHRVRGAAQLRRSSQGRALSRVLQDHGGIQLAGRRERHRHLARARHHGRPRAARRARLQDAPHLALRRCAGGRGRALGVPVRALDRHRHLRDQESGLQLGLGAAGRPGDAAGGDRCDLEADQLQLPVLSRRPAIHSALAHRGRSHRRRRPRASFLDHRLSAAVADDFLSARRQHRVRVLRHLRGDRFHDPGRAGGRHPDSRLQGVLRRRESGRPRRLVGAVGHPDADRDRAHRRAVQVHREKGAVLNGRLMVENRPWLTVVSHAVLIAGIAVIAFPLYVTFVASTLTLDQILQVPMPLVPGDRLWENYSKALTAGASGAAAAPVGRMMLNSLVMAAAIALGKIAISLIASFAIVYFRFPLRNFFFWMIFVTLMLPVEVRIIPTYKVVSDLGILNSYVGLTLPLIASATATFLFRQFFLTIPEELAEASRIDGAGPMRFFFDVVLPLSKTSMAALFVIQFISGRKQYLWPLLVTTDESMYTVVIGIKRMIAGGEAATEWNLVMATAMLAMLPPALLVLLTQTWFVKGLVDTEK